MPGSLMQVGRNPRDGGEEWMWATGEVGVWPESGNVEERDTAIGEEGWKEEETRGLVDALQDIGGGP